MATQGSNELNALLKAKVVKILVELDYKNSKLPTQVNNISKFLADQNKAVKLKVELDINIKDFNKQISGLQAKLEESKTAKPSMKLQVDIDVAGSATNIKKQLQDIYKVVGDFNKKYGEQIKQMQQQINTPTGGKSGKISMPVLDTSAFVKSISEAKTYMGKFGEGLFTSQEFKNAQGEITGFVGTLTKANGIIEKIKYEWNADKGSFVPISAQTLTQTEAMVHKVEQVLKSLFADIQNLNNGQGKGNVLNAYNSMLRDSEKMTMDNVVALQAMIKNQQAIDQTIKSQNKDYQAQQELIRKITNAREADWAKSQDFERRKQFNGMLQDVRTNPDVNLKEQALELRSLNDLIARENQQELELIANTKKRMQVLQQIRQIQTQTVSNDRTSQALIGEIKLLAQRAKTAQDYLTIQQKMNSLKDSNANDAMLQRSLDLQQKIQLKMKELVATGKMTSEEYERAIEQLPVVASRSFADLERQYSLITRRLKDEQSKMKEMANESKLLVAGSNTGTPIQSLVNSRDINELQRYFAEMYNGQVQTMSMRNTTNSLGQAVTEMRIKMEGTGKQVETYTVQMNRLDGSLRQTGQGMEYNANRNLGIFEQLRIAMERVPVWTIAMTAWYGTLRGIKEMVSQIMELDKSLTELKRVAGANLNIDILFKGAVDLSKQLGNNVMDVLNSVGELARTFGDFNERQLLAITKTATLMSNVSDLTAEEATNNLVGTMNAFNISAEESIHIVDALNEVDNNYAISTKQLAEGLSKTASTAKTFGVSMEEVVGQITAIGAVTMESGAIIGNSLKSIYSRITTVKQAKVELQSVGVAITDSTGDYRKVDNILGDLAQRWTDLSSTQQQNIAINVAGRYQLSRFLALMNNWQMATDATNTAINSQGSAMRENEKYLGSFEARMNTLKSGFTELASAVGNSILSAGMMAVIGSLTKIAQLGVTVANNFGALPAVLVPIVLILGKMGILDSIFISFAKFALIPSKLGALKTFWGSLATATRDFTNAYEETLAVTGGSATKVQAVSSAWRAVTVAEDGATTAVGRFGIAVRGFLASTLIGVAIIALGYLFEKLMNMYEAHKQKLEELQKLNDKMVSSYRLHADGMQSLIARYDELDGKVSRTKDEQNEYLKLQKQLANEIPTTVAYIDANGVAHMKNTTEINKEIESVKKLSQANAELTQAKFLDNMNQQSDAYMKIIKNVDDLYAKQQRLKADDGKSAWTNGKIGEDQYKAGSFFSTIDNSKAIQENKVEIMMAEADKTKAIQQTIKSVQDQSLAYFESKGKLADLGDAQQGVIEKFISYNESMLRYAKTPEQFQKAYQDLFTIGTKVGDVWSQAFEKMGKSMQNDPMALNQLKSDLGDVAKSVPETFYQMTDAMGRPTKSIDQITNGLKEIINVSNRVAQGDGNWNALVGSLQKAGLSADQAKVMLNNLAREHDNAKLRAEAQAQGVDGLTASMDDLNQQTLKALDLTQQLFGYNSDDLSSIKTRIQTMHLLIDTEGQGAKNTDEYKQAQQELTDMLGLSNSELEKNKGRIFDTVEALGKLDLSTYSMSDSFSEFVNKNKDLTQAQKNLLIEWSKTKGAKDIITGANKELVTSNQTVAKSVKNIQDVFAVKPDNQVAKAVNDTKKAVEDKSWIQKFGDSMKGFAKWLSDFIPPSFASDLNKAGDSIGNFFKSLPSKAKKGLDDFGNAIDKALGGVPSKIISNIGQWGKDTGVKLDQWWQGIEGWFKSLPSKQKSSSESFSKWWAGLVKYMDNLPDQTRPKLEAWYVSMKEWFATLPKRIAVEMGKGYVAVWDFIHDLKTETPKKLDEWWQAFVDWFNGIPDRIKKKMEEWKKTSDDQSTAMRKSFVKNLDKWWNDFSNWLDSIPSRISKKLEGWENAFSGWERKQDEENKKQYGKWGENISKAFGDIGKNIYDGWDKWIRSIPPLDTWGSKIQKSLTDWKNGIANWFTKNAKTVSNGISDWFKSIPNMPLVQNIGKQLDKMKTNVDKWFETNGKLFYTNFDHMIRNIPPLNTWGDNIKKSMDKAWTKVQDWFVTEKDSIGKNLKKMFTVPDMSKWGTDIKKWLDNTGTTIKKWFDDTKDAWGKGLDGWWKNAREWFLGLGKKKEVHDAGKNMLDGVQKGVDDNKNSEIDKLGKTIVDIMEKVLEAIGIIALAVGRELLKRFIKGFEKDKADFDKAWDKLKKKATDKVVEMGDNVHDEAKKLPSRMAQGIQEKIKEWEDKWGDIKQKAIDKLTETKNDLKTLASKIPKAIGDGIKGAISDLDDGIKSVVNKIAGGVEGGLNGVIGGIDSVLTYMEVPEGKQIPKVHLPRYEEGTDSQGHQGGHALVGEKGRELAYLPKVGYTMLGENGAEILDLPKGTSVLPNKETETLLKKHGFPAYENGVGDWFNQFFQSPKDLMSKVWGSIPMSPITGGGFLGDIAEGGINKAKDSAVDFIANKIKGFFSVDNLSSIGGSVGGNVTGWLTTAMKLTGVPMTWLSALQGLVQHESGGNPKSVNLWDSNAKAGHPSKGLFQTIDSTFNQYKLNGLGDIFNPIANAVAGIRYILDRYGSIFNTPGIKSMANGGGYRGYANGGIVDKMELAWHGEEGAEAIIPLIEKRRGRGLDLWKQAGEKLGIAPNAIEWLMNYLGKKGGGQASSGNGSVGASSGDGGGEGGGGDSGASGTIIPSMPSLVGGINLDGNYQMSALALADPVAIDQNSRDTTAIGGNISELQGEMSNMNKSTREYRDLLKEILYWNNKNLDASRKEYAYWNQREASDRLRLSQLPALSKQTEAQRNEYNGLQQELDTAIQKQAQLKGDIQTQMGDIKAKSLEMWTDFINEISTNYDNAIATVKQKVDNTDFKISVMKMVTPDDMQGLLNQQAQKAQDLQSQVGTNWNKYSDLHTQYTFATQRQGVNSDEAKAVKDQMDKAMADYQQSVQDVLTAEQDIKDTRAKIADDGITQLKDYYTKMKDMATNAIDTEKAQLQKEHDDKMKMYDDETTAINNIYDAKTKALDATNAQTDYNSQLSDKNKAVADLQNKIALLSRDTSLEGKQKVADLQTQLVTASKDLSDFQTQHQRDQAKQALDDQKQAQLDAISSSKDLDQKAFDDKNTQLDAEKDVIAKHYDDLINNDKKWADMRDEAIKGNFSTIKTELQSMTDNINLMNKGIFDGLTASFSTYSDTVKEQIAEANALTVSNMNYDYAKPTDAVSQASGANAYTVTNGSVPSGTGTKVVVPDVTSPAPPPPTPPAPTPKPSTPQSAPAQQAQAHGWKTTSSLNMRSGTAYGNNVILVIPKGAVVDYEGMVNGWAKVKYNGKTGYAGKNYLQQFDTGGYTGDWNDNSGKLAVLHKKELVLNQEQTKNILDTAKIMDKIKGFLPNVSINSIADRIATAGNITTNITYGDIVVTVEGGDKKKSTDIAKEILTGIKKMGR